MRDKATFKWSALLLTIALAFNPDGSALQTQEPDAESPAQKAAQKKADKVRAEVTRRGVGEKSRVRVKLRDGFELKGHITRIDPDSFELQSDPDPLLTKDGLITVSYANVVKIRGPQSGVARISRNVGITIAVVAVLTGLALFALWDYNRRNRY